MQYIETRYTPDESNIFIHCHYTIERPVMGSVVERSRRNQDVGIMSPNPARVSIINLHEK